jgi:uncharacterized short protein YbdD (DUF466 family)
MRWNRRGRSAGPGWRARLRTLRRAARAVLGVPDYEAYVEHCRRRGHPVRQSEREFMDAAFAARGRAPRCC